MGVMYIGRPARRTALPTPPRVPATPGAPFESEVALGRIRIRDVGDEFTKADLKLLDAVFGYVDCDRNKHGTPSGIVSEVGTQSLTLRSAGGKRGYDLFYQKQVLAQQGWM